MSLTVALLSFFYTKHLKFLRTSKLLQQKRKLIMTGSL